MKGKNSLPRRLPKSCCPDYRSERNFENPRPAGSWRPLKCIFSGKGKSRSQRAAKPRSGVILTEEKDSTQRAASPVLSVLCTEKPDRGSLRRFSLSHCSSRPRRSYTVPHRNHCCFHLRRWPLTGAPPPLVPGNKDPVGVYSYDAVVMPEIADDRLFLSILSRFLSCQIVCFHKIFTLILVTFPPRSTPAAGRRWASGSQPYKRAAARTGCQ